VKTLRSGGKKNERSLQKGKYISQKREVKSASRPKFIGTSLCEQVEKEKDLDRIKTERTLEGKVIWEERKGGKGVGERPKDRIACGIRGER